MMRKLAYGYLIALLSLCCWGMDSQNLNNDKRELNARLQKARSPLEHENIKKKFKLEKNISFIDELINNITEKRRILTNKDGITPDRICESVISGQDWFSCSSYPLTLTAEQQIVIPWRDWLHLNCEITITEIEEKKVKLLVTPDTFPILGDSPINCATWKAVVWLEAHAQVTDEKLTELPPEILQGRLDELDTCERNLRQEKQRLQIKLREISDPC